MIIINKLALISKKIMIKALTWTVASLPHCLYYYIEHNMRYIV